MTQDEIIEMAKQARLTVTYIGEPIGLSYAQIAHFAKLAAAKEREACAKFFDDNDTLMFWGSQAAREIRARGKNDY